jgi:hypothetical protein
VYFCRVRLSNQEREVESIKELVEVRDDKELLCKDDWSCVPTEESREGASHSLTEGGLQAIVSSSGAGRSLKA